ncbi:hypothetical protein [Streptomyces sp. 6N223]|uniref:hypothetical protein n=1 Tax=Streptomyces sp. 6N223 TaxID=3457412 RepID=UPI003FD5D8D9
MPRRVSLPAADELFRSTGGAAVQPSTPPEHASGTAENSANSATANSANSVNAAPRVPAPAGERRPAGAGPSGEGGGEEETAAGKPGAERAVPGQGKRAAGTRAAGAKGAAGASEPSRRGRAARRPSGRERHDEKITVYVSAEELMDLEHARLVLRGEHGLAVDRGRIVREAVAVVLADLESRGEASILVRRLRGR